MVRPDAINHDPRRERIFGPSEPSCEGQTAARLACARPRRGRDERGLPIGQHGRDARFHQRSGVGRVSSPQKVRGGRIPLVPQGPDLWFKKFSSLNLLDLPPNVLSSFLVVSVKSLELFRLNLERFVKLLYKVLLDVASL